MATKFYLTDITSALDAVFVGVQYDASLVADIAAAAISQNTAAGPTAGVEIGTAALGVRQWYTKPLNAVTIASTITANLWMAESNMSANVGAQFSVHHCDAAGNILSNIVNSEKGTELPVATRAAQNWTATPTSDPINDGERLLIRVYGNDVGTMATGYTFSLSVSGPTAGADGDSYISFTEAITEYSGPPATNAFAQASYDILDTGITIYAQAQAWISTNVEEFGQAQADIESTYNIIAQTQAQIVFIATNTIYGQARVAIKQTALYSAQASTWIKNQGKLVYGQARASIKTTSQRFAQAQTGIKDTGITVYAQTQFTIKATGQKLAQVQAYIINKGLIGCAQTLASIVLNLSTHEVFGQGLGQIGVTDNLYSALDESAYDDNDYILNNDGSEAVLRFASAEVPDYKTAHKILWRAQGSSLDITLYQGINPIVTLVSQPLTNVFVTYSYDLTSSEISSITDYTDLRIGFTASTGKAIISWVALQVPKGTPRRYAQAQATLITGIIVKASAQAQGYIRQTSKALAQSQAYIKQILFNVAQVQADIRVTYKLSGQAQVAIRQTYRVFAQAITDIQNSYQVSAQVMAKIKAQSQKYAQSQAQIKTTYKLYSQATAQIKQISQVYAQASVRVRSTFLVAAQAQAQIYLVGMGYANSGVAIKQVYGEYAQAQTQILGLYVYQKYSNAQGLVKTTVNIAAQAVATIILSDIIGTAQAQALIVTSNTIYAQVLGLVQTSEIAYAQTQAVLSKSAGYGQAQLSIAILHQLKKLVIDNKVLGLVINDRDSLKLLIADRAISEEVGDEVSLGLEILDRVGITLVINDVEF